MTASVKLRSPVDWVGLRTQLNWVNRIAIQDLIDIFDRTNDLDPRAAREFLEAAVVDLAGSYGSAADMLTVGWWNGLVGDETQFVAQGYALDRKALKNQAHWATYPIATGKGDARARLAGVLQKAIFAAHRGKVAAGVEQNRWNYARMARADACPFCRILASRGAVYSPQGSATEMQQAGSKFHDNCRCLTVPDIPGRRLELPSYYERFEKEYLQATRGIEGPVTMKKATSIMHQQLKEPHVH